MKYLRKYNESTDSKDGILDFYTLEELFLPLSDILDVDMTEIKYDENGKFIYGINPIYVRLGELKVTSFDFSFRIHFGGGSSAETYDRLIRSINTKISNIDGKIEQLNNIKNKLNILKEKIDSELPDIIHRLQQFKHFDSIKFGATHNSLVIIIYLKDWGD